MVLFFGLNKAYFYFELLSLGAYHDGSSNAIDCPASLNNLMTPILGDSIDSQNAFYFSACSIKSFKLKLLTADRKFVEFKVLKIVFPFC